MALRRILTSPATGEVLGGTALSNPMKFLSGIEPLQVVGARVPGGYRVRGQLPWVSNLGPGHVFGLVFRVEDGREVMALASCDAEGITLDRGAHFTALEGTRTFALRFDDMFVPEGWLLADPARSYLARIKAGFILMQTGMGMGLVAGCIDIMRRADRALSHVNCFLDDRPDELEAELAALRRGCAPPGRHAPGARSGLPAAGARGAAARGRAVDPRGQRRDAARGRARLPGARPAQRRLREAYFVAIVTPAIKHLRKVLAGMGA